jgi:hypothetical protein
MSTTKLFNKALVNTALLILWSLWLLGLLALAAAPVAWTGLLIGTSTAALGLTAETIHLWATVALVLTPAPLRLVAAATRGERLFRLLPYLAAVVLGTRPDTLEVAIHTGAWVYLLVLAMISLVPGQDILHWNDRKNTGRCSFTTQAMMGLLGGLAVAQAGTSEDPWRYDRIGLFSVALVAAWVLRSCVDLHPGGGAKPHQETDAVGTIQRWWRSLPKKNPLETLWRGLPLNPQYGPEIVRMILELVGQDSGVTCYRWGHPGPNDMFPARSVLVRWRDVLVVMPPETDLGVDCPETSRTWSPAGVKSILDPEGEYYFSNRERWLAGAMLSTWTGYTYEKITDLHGSGALLLWIAELVLKERGTNPVDCHVLDKLPVRKFRPRTKKDLEVLLRLLQSDDLEDRTRYHLHDPRARKRSYVSRERALEIISELREGGKEKRYHLAEAERDFDRCEKGTSNLERICEDAEYVIEMNAHLLTPELCVEFFKVLESRGPGHRFTVPKASPEGVRLYMLERGLPALVRRSIGFHDCPLWTERAMTVFGPEAVKEFFFSEDGPRGRYPILLGTLVEHVGFPAGLLAGAVDTWIGSHKWLLMKMIARASGDPEDFRGLVVHLVNKGDPLVLNAMWKRYSGLMTPMFTTNRRLEALVKHGMCSTPGCHGSIGGKNRVPIDRIVRAIGRGETVTTPTGIYCKDCCNPGTSVPRLLTGMIQAISPRDWHGVFCSGPCCASWGIQVIDRVKVVDAPEDFPRRVFVIVFSAERPPTEEGYHSTSREEGNAFVAVLKPDGSGEFPEKNAFLSVLQDCYWHVPTVRIYEIPKNGRVHCVGMGLISGLPFTETTVSGPENWEEFSEFISKVLAGIDPDDIAGFHDLGVDPKNPEAVLKEAYPTLVQVRDELRKTSPSRPISPEKFRLLLGMIYNSRHFPGKNEIPGLQEIFGKIKTWLTERVNASSMCALYCENPERFDQMVVRMLSHPVDGPWVRQLAVDSSVRHGSVYRCFGGLKVPSHLIPVGPNEHPARNAVAYALRLWGWEHLLGPATVPSGKKVTRL